MGKEIYLLKHHYVLRFRGFSIDSDLKGLTLSEGLEVLISNPDGVKVCRSTLYNLKFTPGILAFSNKTV